MFYSKFNINEYVATILVSIFIVAVISLYINYLSGYQGALMAPTEILAHQHYTNIKKILIFLENYGQVHISFLGFVAILASILGLVSSFYLRRNEEAAGIGFLIATMFVIVGADHINVISALFLLSAGILTLFRK